MLKKSLKFDGSNKDKPIHVQISRGVLYDNEEEPKDQLADVFTRVMNYENVKIDDMDHLYEPNVEVENCEDVDHGDYEAENDESKAELTFFDLLKRLAGQDKVTEHEILKLCYFL